MGLPVQESRWLRQRQLAKAGGSATAICQTSCVQRTCPLEPTIKPE